MSESPIMEDVRNVLATALQLGESASEFGESTQLLGTIPELDSMAVVTVLTELEAQFGFVVHDDEVSADTFETMGTLVQFVERKLES